MSVRAVVRDPARVQAVRSIGLLDTPAEESFDRLTRLAASLLDAPIAIVNLVDEDRQFFKSCIGIAEPLASEREMPVEHSFCQHAMAAGDPLVLPDTRKHPLYRTNPNIVAMGIVAYLGIPLVLDGQALGALCVIDHVPHAWTSVQVQILSDLAASVLTEIGLRRTSAEAMQARAEAESLLAQLLQAETSYRLLVDTAPQIIWRANADAVIAYYNERWFAYTGLSPAQSSVDGWAAVVHPEDLPRVVESWAQALLAGTTWEAEYRLRRADGSFRWHLGRSLPVRDSTSTLTHWMGSATDIHDHKQAEEERLRLHEAERQARAVAQAALEDRDAFIASVAHDLKSPLTAVRGHAELLRRKAQRSLSPDAAWLTEGLTRVERATDQMTSMVGELVDLARLHSGRSLDLVPAPTDLGTLVQRCADEAQATARSHTIVVEPPATALVGSWDAARIERVVANLLTNALKYSPNGGVIDVRVELECAGRHRWAVLTVADHGIGIPAADLPRIFERFHRGANVAGRISGSGIGLAGARQIVEQHGGTIGVTSAPGDGAAFTVRLPLEPVDGVSPAAALGQRS